VYANRLDSPKTFRTMREEQERADDRRDAAQEMMTINRLGKRAVRCKILVWQLHGRCQTMSISLPIICGSGCSVVRLIWVICSALTAAFLPSLWGMLLYSDDTSMVGNIQLVGRLSFQLG